MMDKQTSLLSKVTYVYEQVGHLDQQFVVSMSDR